MVRTVKVCATVPTAHAATTSMEAAYASRASVAHTAGTGCVHLANTACTANARVSARTSTRSGERALSEEEEGGRGLSYANISPRQCCSGGRNNPILLERNLNERSQRDNFGKVSWLLVAPFRP